MIGQASRRPSRLTDDVAPTGASKTIDVTRSGKAIARAIAAPLAKLCATTVTRSMPWWSRKSTTATAFPANPTAGRWLRP